MRIWSLHPKYLDQKGLVALWAEGLLAKKVLEGRTRGWMRHPQLNRFRDQEDPVTAINRYLAYVLEEGKKRGYRFEAQKLDPGETEVIMPVAKGQLYHEWGLLLARLKTRAPDKYGEIAKVSDPEPHPVFEKVDGGVEEWEKTGV